MGRYSGPVCRRCRREGMKLFLKGDRCGMAKCPIEQGDGLPGMHGARRAKLSDYGRQFREKQKIQRIYGIRDGQFRVFFERARRAKGNTGERLLQSLELRLDSVVYRLGFARSRAEARQMVRHGHLTVNRRRASVPSMVLEAGDVVEVKNHSSSRELVKRMLETAQNKTLGSWLTLDAENLRGEVTHVPSRDEMQPVVDEQLVVELCSK